MRRRSSCAPDTHYTRVRAGTQFAHCAHQVGRKTRFPRHARRVLQPVRLLIELNIVVFKQTNASVGAHKHKYTHANVRLEKINVNERLAFCSPSNRLINQYLNSTHHTQLQARTHACQQKVNARDETFAARAYKIAYWDSLTQTQT